MKVEIWLMQSSQAMIHENAGNTYTKGDLFCVYDTDKKIVFKYPVDHIFRIVETNFNQSAK
jgi:hypothetical protein